ncbi:MAG TPA: hypothetical protein DIW20_05775 [Rhodospirillaceae bacterium]|nr:hypothetical protein [Rhodospirillaceae bacterium]
MDLPIKTHPGGVMLTVRAVPGARQAGIRGIVSGRGGGVALKVAVTAPPEDGKATSAIIALLSRAWKIPKTAFSLQGGGAAREKTFLIAGDVDRLFQSLLPHLAGL